MDRPPFVCPVCGADVPGRAKACPECGADERTGWSANTVYDGTDIEDPAADEFDHDEWLRRELGRPPSRTPRQWLWWTIAVLLLVLLVWWLVGHGA